MDELFGPFEKSILGLLAVAIGLYLILARLGNSFPDQDLKQLYSIPAPLMDSNPRTGDVVSASQYSMYVSNNDPEKINLFAKGTDGKKHPSNAYLLGFAPFQTQKYWVPLLAVSLRVRYMTDAIIKYDDDVWQTSVETYKRMWGDCEDHAILLADWMIKLGYDARVAVGTVNGQGHAWVVLFKDGKEYLLEATDKGSRRRYPLVALHPEYVSFCMFNRDHFWAVLTKKDYRGRIQSQEWAILSDFREIPSF